NLSVLAIPAYYLLTLFPHAYAISLTSPSLLRTDNRNPRSTTHKTSLREKLPPARFATYERSEAAHSNGLENLPLFASAVILGNVARLPQKGWDGLEAFAGAYLVVRAAYFVAYVRTEENRYTLVRSALWAASVALCVRVFVKAGRVLGG
ncbi:hypothetical protein K402DRAFT_308158, partial [Aulographum hederae CBS 113979]